MKEKEKLQLHTIRLYPSERTVLAKLSKYLKLYSEGRVIGQLLREKIAALKRSKAIEAENAKSL